MSLIDRLRLATTGSYEVSKPIGSGGFATVFLAKDTRLHRMVAIKVLDPQLGDQPGMAERFVKEARTLARLEHPHIISIYEIGRPDGLSFLVMPLVRGSDVDEIQRTVHLTIDEVLCILLQAASGLAAAHAQRVVHRDVKPANMLVNTDGTLIVSDFGIAKALDDTSSAVTSKGMGSVQFVSPEQIRGDPEMPIGPATDQYSLGVTAFLLLTGRFPFEGNNDAIIVAHLYKPPPSIRELRLDCPEDLERAVLRMLAKEPSDRWASLIEFSQFLHGKLPDGGAAVRTRLAATARRLYEMRNGPPRVNPPPPPPPLRLAAISPSSLQLFVGGTSRLTATESVRGAAMSARVPDAWRSSNPAIASVATDGSVTGVAPGAVVITAKFAGTEASARVEVIEPPIIRLVAQQSELRAWVGEEVQPVVAAVDAIGRVRTPGRLRWTSSDPRVAAATAEGRFRATSAGTVLLTCATDAGVAGAAPLTLSVTVAVSVPPTPTVVIRPIERAIVVGSTTTLVAEQVNSQGTPIGTARGRWVSHDPSVMRVEPSGSATALRPGIASISVTVDSQYDEIDLLVVEEPVSSIALSVAARVLQVGEVVPLLLIVRTATGEIRSSDGVRLRSTSPDVVDIGARRRDASGLDALVVRALKAGVSGIEADVPSLGPGGPQAALMVRVAGAVLARLMVETPAYTLTVGEDARIFALPLDPDGRALPVPLTWTSGSPEVATVESDGKVVARADGCAVVTITADMGDGQRIVAETRIRVGPPSMQRLVSPAGPRPTRIREWFPAEFPASRR